MKSDLKNAFRKRLAVALVSSLAAPGFAMAATIGLDPTNPVAAPGGETAATVVIDIPAGDPTNAFSGRIEFDPALFSAVAVDPAGPNICAANNVNGRVAIVASGLSEGETEICDITFTALGGTAEGDYPLVWGGPPVFGGSDGGDTAVPPTITVALAPPEPPTVTFAPNGGAINLTAPGGALQGSESNATAIAITAVGGSGAGSGSYTCVDPGAPFTVTNLANANVLVGSDPADISVTCTLDDVAVSDALACTRTGGDATPVNFTLNCPAGAPIPSPEYSSAPAAGATLNCDGDPGSLTETSITITNTGLAGVGSDLDVTSCSTTGAGFSVIAGANPAPIAVGASTVVTVQCTVPAEDAPAATGELTCTSNDAGNSPAVYPLSSIADTALPAVPQPNVVPASSLWSQLSLIGLLAALGLLVVGIRRNH